ncbi:MAG: V-type ATP synthase subunit I [Treponema sp.]|nr:V-type ATP synthase subunit I [Treponema sp.]
MKKVCLVVQEHSQNNALLKLREAGVLHIEKRASPESVAKSAEQKNKVESAIGLLSETYKKRKKSSPVSAVNAPRVSGAGLRRGRRSTDIYGTEEQEPYSLEAVNAASRMELPDYIVNIGRERKSLEDRMFHLKKEIIRIENWGDFDPAAVKEIAGLGQPVYLYELTLDAFNRLDKEVEYIIKASEKNKVRIIVFGKELENSTPVILPEKSISAMRREIDEIKLELEELNAKLNNLVSRMSALKKEMILATMAYEFESAAAVVEKVEEIPENLGLCYLTGYVPAEDMSELRATAVDNGWALSAVDPAEDDEKVPTKLKNSKFVNLLNPITDFLGITPGYREVDISAWFLIFFCIYFGMIFGDAAYGLILTLAAVFGIIKTAKKGVPVPLQMLFLLGICNTAWGIATCSWFGVELDLLPQVPRDISLSYISTAKRDSAIVDQNLLIFCFSLGLLQLTIAHVRCLFSCIRLKSLKFLSEIGSLGMIWGMFNVVLWLIVSNDARQIPLLPVSLYIMGGGFILNFVFASYEGSIGMSILNSCKNFISVVLGIANIFSDVMSYIRLWAVGLAGASIANTVNTMAGPMLGNFLIFIGIILLVFGHGLNLILNVLSVLVHGVRLNILEFSSHIGLSWSGIAYKPFAEKNK